MMQNVKQSASDWNIPRAVLIKGYNTCIGGFIHDIEHKNGRQFTSVSASL